MSLDVELDWVARELAALRHELRPAADAGGLVLALDQGGHASRAVLFDGAGRDVAEARVPVATHREGPDRVEHDPDELLASLRVAAQDVCDSAAARGREIVAAGLACQRSTEFFTGGTVRRYS